jgi:cyclin B
LLNHPKSSRIPSSSDLNLSTPFLDINNNKSKSNIKNIFHIDKTPKIKKNSDSNNNDININNNDNNNNKNIINYSYLNFDFNSDQEKVSFAGEYLEDIYLNLLLEERQTEIKPKMGYMSTQNEINEQMRAILIDWIIEVHFQFNLRQETLYMTISIIDTYLSFHFISRKELQLLGIACLLISCKSQEIYYPQQNKFIEVTDGAYTKEDMLKMENDILKKLNFNIVYPTPNDFYNILSKLYNFDKKQYFLGKYFIECVLIDYQMIKYSSSVIAAACIYLVMKYFGINGYQKLYSNCIINENNPENIIKDSAKNIYELVGNLSKSKLKTVKNKYGLTQFENVSEIL